MSNITQKKKYHNVKHFYRLTFLWWRVLVCSGRTTPIMHFTICICRSCCGNRPREAVRHRLDCFPALPTCPGPAVINIACMCTSQ